MRNGIRSKRAKMLNNRIYVGDAVHKGTAYPGGHSAIIPRQLLDKVHSILTESPRKRAASARTGAGAAQGLLFGPTGCAMAPTHLRKAAGSTAIILTRPS